jgi:hypothetical protein
MAGAKPAKPKESRDSMPKGKRVTAFYCLVVLFALLGEPFGQLFGLSQYG